MATSPATRKTARAPLPDRAAMLAYAAARTPAEIEAALSQAQQVIYDAWEAASARPRATLARKALGICPLCADALNILAGDATDTEQRVALYTLAMDAGEIGLGPKQFRELSGEFWGWLETRPYMRARHGLALSLLDMGRRAEAIEHLQAMLALNPNDNQGIRYVLHDALLSAEDIPALRKLLRAYKDDWSVHWLYTQALLAFRDGKGDTPATRKLVADAVECNPHVPEILAAGRSVRGSRNALIAMGSPEEAIEYLSRVIDVWQRTPGAIDWLVATVGAVRQPAATRRRQAG